MTTFIQQSIEHCEFRPFIWCLCLVFVLRAELIMRGCSDNPHIHFSLPFTLKVNGPATATRSRLKNEDRTTPAFCLFRLVAETKRLPCVSCMWTSCSSQIFTMLLHCVCQAGEVVKHSSDFFHLLFDDLTVENFHTVQSLLC